MTVLLKDTLRTLGATGFQYRLPGAVDANLSIANNNNGAGVDVTVQVTDVDGGRWPLVTVPAYQSQFLSGIYRPLIVDVQGNGANVSIVLTTTDEEFRIEPISLVVSSPNPIPVTQSGAWTVAVSNFNKVSTWVATYRLAARPYALSFLFTANTRKQFAVIWHPATSTRAIRLRRVLVALESASAAAIIMADLVRLGVAVPSGGNPAITPAGVATTSSLVDASLVTLALPTTGGTENSPALRTDEWNLGITGAGSALNPPPPLTWHDLLDPTGDGPQDLQTDLFVMRAGSAEGYAVVLDCNAGITVKAYVLIEFQEDLT